MSWLFITIAVACEVGATLCLRGVSQGSRRLIPVVAGGYVAAFASLSAALAHGMALGVAYGIWTAVGVAATALLSRALFGEPLNRLMLTGIGLITVGVVLIELGAAH